MQFQKDSSELCGGPKPPYAPTPFSSGGPGEHGAPAGLPTDRRTTPMTTETSTKTKFTVGDVFRQSWNDYIDIYGVPTSRRAKVAHAVRTCRTPERGAYTVACDNPHCDQQHVAYGSCNNRHCPTCGGKRSREWLRDNSRDLLPATYWHVVLKLSHDLNGLVRCNPSLVYSAIVKGGAEALQAVASRELDGAELGTIAMLHTWGNSMCLHPHGHFHVTGGGLSRDTKRWHSTDPDSFLDMEAVGREFRKVVLRQLRNAYRKGKLWFDAKTEHLNHKETFEAFLKEQAEKDWGVYCRKVDSHHPEHVLQYLSRHSHSVGITNDRIVLIADDGRVLFSYNDYENLDEHGHATVKYMHLSGEEFIHRFLSHILPAGFHKIRFYGILASNRNKAAKLAAARALLQGEMYSTVPAALQAQADYCPGAVGLTALTGSAVVDTEAPTVCPSAVLAHPVGAGRKEQGTGSAPIPHTVGGGPAIEDPPVYGRRRTTRSTKYTESQAWEPQTCRKCGKGTMRVVGVTPGTHPPPRGMPWS